MSDNSRLILRVMVGVLSLLPFFLFLGLGLGNTYCTIAIVLALVLYWSFNVVPLAYTAIIPVVGFSLLEIPIETILRSFIHPALLVIVGPAVVVLAASECGLVDRVANYLSRKVGPDFRKQILLWLVLATSLSFFAANIAVAIVLTPVAVAVLKRHQYGSPAAIASNKSATMMIIALAIGASLGGIMTPMAGGQAAITWSGLNDFLGGEVTVLSFTLRMVMPVLLSLGVVFLIFLFLPIGERKMKKKPRVFDIKRNWSGREYLTLATFTFSVILPYVRPLLPATLPEIYAILILTMVVIYVPREGMLLPIRQLKRFPWHAFSLWPIAMSVSILIAQVGVGSSLIGLVGEFWNDDPYVGVAKIVGLSVFTSNLVSDTSAAGILIPLVTQSLPDGMNAIPWLLMVGFSVNLSFMILAPTGTIAIPLAFGGKNHPWLPLYGLIVVLACGLLSWVFWTAVFSLGLDFWFTLETV